MHASTPRQPRGRITALAVLVGVLALYHVALILFQSARPENYYEYTGTRSPLNKFAFPYVGVSVSIGLLVLEATLLTFVLTRRFGPLWLRGTLCLAVLIPLTLFGIAGVMHAPPYFLAHVRWLFIAALLVLLLVIVSGSTSLYHKLRANG